ncbi:MAG: hypothetical protein AB1641_23425 [Thermodesulfobacteriota bacterium]
MKPRSILLICLWLLILGLMPACASADIKPEEEKEAKPAKELFEKYWNLKEKQSATPSRPPTEAQPPRQQPAADCPGWILGEWEKRPDDLFREPWPYRAMTYELLFPTKKDIARTIYGLALFTRDLDPSVTLERFERGAGGFHYSLDQIVGWANAIEEKKQAFFTREEEAFLNKLVEDKVILKVQGRYVSLRQVSHVLGAAPMQNKSLVLNLDHERLHVFWDEDRSFQDSYIRRWRALSEADKEAVYSQLKGYNKENEMLIIEEWAVRQNEQKPFWKK